MISALLLSSMLATMTVPPMTEAELKAASDVVVEGVVTGQQVHKIGGRIFTFSTLVVGELFEAKSYLVALPGGDLDGLSQRVPGSPQLVVGQRYRLYLGKANGPPQPGSRLKSRGVVGFFRGAFLVDPSGPNGQHKLIPFTEEGAPVLVK